jgi:endonuclease YncB( thermonuclease family)
MMKRLFPLVAALLSTIGPVLADDLTGQASTIDGDTIEIHGTRIRLWGIDAPESTQLCRGEDSLQYRCGAKAANDLDAFIARRSVSCTPISLDQYGRTVATCTVDGTDLGQWLVRNGLALDWPNYSHGMYDKIQREAEHAGRGMWSGSYVAPWLYRTCIRAGGRPADCSDDANGHP